MIMELGGLTGTISFPGKVTEIPHWLFQKHMREVTKYFVQ